MNGLLFSFYTNNAEAMVYFEIGTCFVLYLFNKITTLVIMYF